MVDELPVMRFVQCQAAPNMEPQQQAAAADSSNQQHSLAYQEVGMQFADAATSHDAPMSLYVGVLKPSGRPVDEHCVQAEAVQQLFVCPEWAWEGLERPESENQDAALLPAAATTEGMFLPADAPQDAALLPAAARTEGMFLPADAPPPKRSCPRPKALQKHQNYTRKTVEHYVCTAEGCGWSGTKASRHGTAGKGKPGHGCTISWPCSLTLPVDRSKADVAHEVAAFLERCTPAQRAQGLPPDGAKPVPRAGPDGHLSHTPLYCTVPANAAEGQQFVLPMGPGPGVPTRITVPSGLGPGDLLAVAATKHGYADRRPSASADLHLDGATHVARAEGEEAPLVEDAAHDPMEVEAAEQDLPEAAGGASGEPEPGCAVYDPADEQSEGSDEDW